MYVYHVYTGMEPYLAKTFRVLQKHSYITIIN